MSWAHVFRVEKGVVAVFERRIGRPANIIEMAGQGDYVGLGCLEQHRDNARAVVESVVSVLPRCEFALLAEHDAKLRKKQDDAIKRDFEHGKALANNRGSSAPVECVAAFLASEHLWALYLGDSMYRIHGTDAPWTIGTAISKGCIRMYNEDVLDLYPRASVGGRVTVTWQRFDTTS